jgi:GNAT superfamily N-acetyltransferase
VTSRRDLIRRLEEVGLATWPALDIERRGGWDLRAAAGVTKRSNSVSPLCPATVPVAEQIAWCERWFATRALPASFRLTELAEPALETALVARGYALDPWVEVMTRPLGRAVSRSPDVELEDQPTPAWLECLMELRFAPGTARSVVQAMLERRIAPTVFASIRMDRSIVALGIGAVHDDHVAIYAMHTVDVHRRRGLGTRLLDGLLAWGTGRGARAGFLQVHSETPGARAMYERAGFEAVYRYWYRMPAP